jgi:sphingomyelin phosphodiesterase acid-like 3
MNSKKAIPACEEGRRWLAFDRFARFGLRILLSCALCAVTGFLLAQQPAHTSRFVWLSDVHWDSTADPALVDRLRKEPTTRWQALLNEKGPGPLSGLGEETNWALLQSALAAAHREGTGASLLIVTGDIFPHHFRRRFAAATRSTDEAEYRQFAKKTFEFVAQQLQTVVPDAPVFITLGNNDEYCEDYQPQPSGPFLADTAATVARLSHAPASSQIPSDWEKRGSYTQAHPTLGHTRIVALNTVPFSPRYENQCGKEQGDAVAEAELDWLEGQFRDAQEHKDKVWLLSHIPPGIDGFATEKARQEEEDTGIVPLWRPEWERRFTTLLVRYPDAAPLLFAAHIHSDAFRTVDGVLTIVGPSVSPNIRQNPAFRVVDFDTNGTVVDQQTFVLSKLASASASDDSARWELEYDFNRAWSTHGLTLSSLRSLLTTIEGSPNLQEQWMRFYTLRTNGASSSRRISWPQFCASGYADPQGFDSCLDRHIASVKPN